MVHCSAVASVRRSAGSFQYKSSEPSHTATHTAPSQVYVSVDFKPLVLCEKLDGVNWSLKLLRMTIHLKSCWSPCFWHGNVKDGAYAIGGYTITMSICIITYIAYLLAGGDTSMLWLPFFETGNDLFDFGLRLGSL